ncbi:FAD-dependent oxidoreductase [Simiduia curdlanivorans]|uniref:FAD-dependent oxidoreductase n=1 Tax=Simiduia curdlanivorans TaxID=1492769 RepID=A0ABV8V0I8_9GAMM|nr:bifunctional TVP38/TMEM64 family protein/FAD-dependent oxidoreductase [Simiduia curdlanivorans]MDN3637750.1 FAD-dependent oxidoreductase [Simiduia curdlanivorans]
MKKIVIATLVIGAIAAFFSLDGARLLSPELYRQWMTESPVLVAVLFGLVYVLATALSLPGAALLTLIAGGLFGLGWGLLIVSFASTIGASLAFLVSRSLLRDWVQSKFTKQLEKINAGVEKDGAFYLFTLRLIPLVPFFVINLVFGLTKVRLWTFYWVSQVGMLAGTAVYVNAGAELGALEELSLKGIMTPTILFAFILLAIFPWLARKILQPLVQALKNNRLYKPFNKPKKFDTNVLVIGAGSAGLVSAYIAAAVKAKVTLIEKHKMGGDCLNTGCVPSKALIKSAAVAKTLQDAEKFGLAPVAAKVDFAAVMMRIQKVIAEVEPHDSIERYTGLGVDCVTGAATIVSPWEVEVAGKRISARSLIIATGARPAIPDIKGLQNIAYYTSDSIWNLRENPGRLAIIGSGPIGCELAQAFARLGAQVTLIGRAPRIMPREDEDVSAFIEAVFQAEKIRVINAAQVQEVIDVQDTLEAKGEKTLRYTQAGQVRELGFDTLLICVGRQANVTGFGASTLGLELTDKGTLAVDEKMRTRFPNVYACGDVAGPYQFTHMAAHQAWYAAVNALFSPFKSFNVDYRIVPWATFTAPEVARVGLSEQEAAAQGIDVELTRYGIDDLDRAIADGEAQGFVKVLTKKGSDKILGAVIVGYHASDLITEFVSAMKHKTGLNDLLSTIHIYPTVSEANKYAAGNWKRAHAPERVLAWVERFHLWRR